MPGVGGVYYNEFDAFKFHVPIDERKFYFVQVLTKKLPAWRRPIFWLQYWLYRRWAYHVQFNNQDVLMTRYSHTGPERLFGPDVALVAWRERCASARLVKLWMARFINQPPMLSRSVEASPQRKVEIFLRQRKQYSYRRETVFAAGCGKTNSGRWSPELWWQGKTSMIVLAQKPRGFYARRDDVAMSDRVLKIVPAIAANEQTISARVVRSSNPNNIGKIIISPAFYELYLINESEFELARVDLTRSTFRGEGDNPIELKRFTTNFGYSSVGGLC